MDNTELEVSIARELKEAREQKAILEGLLAHPGWSILTGLVAAQIEARTRTVMATPLGGDKSLAKQEWDKGEASGMRLALALPKIVIENLESILEENAPNADGPPDSSNNTGTEHDFDPARDFE